MSNDYDTREIYEKPWPYIVVGVGGCVVILYALGLLDWLRP
jgi:hypothetical protein